MEPLGNSNLFSSASTVQSSPEANSNLIGTKAQEVLENRILALEKIRDQTITLVHKNKNEEHTVESCRLDREGNYILSLSNDVKVTVSQDYQVIIDRPETKTLLGALDKFCIGKDFEIICSDGLSRMLQSGDYKFLGKKPIEERVTSIWTCCFPNSLRRLLCCFPIEPEKYVQYKIEHVSDKRRISIKKREDAQEIKLTSDENAQQWVSFPEANKGTFQATFRTCAKASTINAHHIKHLLLEATISENESDPDKQLFKLVECVKVGEAQAREFAGQDLIYCIGPTGSGKSVFMNYMFGCELDVIGKKTYRQKELIDVKANSKDKQVTLIGHGGSKTFFPIIAKHSDQNIAFGDCAGLFDTRPFVASVANACNIQAAFEKAKGVRVIIFIDANSTDVDRAVHLGDSFKTIANLFGSRDNLVECKKSLLICMTKTKRIFEGIEQADFKDYLKELLEDIDTSEYFKDLSDRVFTYDPLDRPFCINGQWKRDTIFEEIRKLTAIDPQRKIFQTFLTKENERDLESLCNHFKAKIETILKGENDISLENLKQVAYYIANLNKLEIIGHPHVIQCLQAVREPVIEFFKGKAQKIRELCVGTSSDMETVTCDIEALKTNLKLFARELVKITKNDPFVDQQE